MMNEVNLESNTQRIREDRAIYRAVKILESRMKVRETVLSSPKSVRDFLRLLLGSEEREMFVVLFMDAQNRLMDSETLFTGTLTQTSVYPREVVKSVIKHNAAAVIFAHNHPSGVPTPSEADKRITKALKDILQVINVRVLDHFVIAGHETLSFAETGLL
jgi:DNA repair protein RadC